MDINEKIEKNEAKKILNESHNRLINENLNAFVYLNNINKIYPNGVQAVYDFNLEVNKHDFIALVGPSGCGKSTTLRMIAGLEEISSGELFIDKVYSNYLPSKDRDIAMVFQSYALYPQMSVFDNIAFPLKINKFPFEEEVDGKKQTIYRKLTKEEIKEKVFSAAKVLDLGQYLDRLPKELSGGQMQRVALGRAIVKNVPLFLMDEPLSNLDAKLRLTMRSEIVKLHNKIGATTIYVTHDQTEAMTMASRVVVMSKGFIQQIDTPKNIYNNPKNIFVAKFIGSPSMNFFDGIYNEDGTVSIGKVKLSFGKDFKQLHDEFYQNKLQEFESLMTNFDQRADEYILKVKSALASENVVNKVKKKENGFQKIINKFSKKEEVNIYEHEIKTANEKISELKLALNSKHNLIFGIRPERIKVSKYEEGMDVKNMIVTTASVCELLGADYNVHFELFNKDIIARVDAKEQLVNGDKLVVKFSKEDIYIFDPVTGETIK